MPPEEPPGLWEELFELAWGEGQDDELTQCAAAEALLGLAIARGLRVYLR